MLKIRFYNRKKYAKKVVSIMSYIFISVLSFKSYALEHHALDPSKVMGPDACAECHEDSADIWKNTHHAKSFKTMARSKEVKGISKAMGVRRIKTSDVCKTCHYTHKVKDSGKKRIKPIAGTSCESCHGAAKEWIDIHSDYGGQNVKRENESPAHKENRIARSLAAGMLMPANMYQLYSRCFDCHTVQNEELINKTDHAPGSEFELVSWSNGEIRHNVMYGKNNPEDTPAKKRVKYILGQMLDLEHALQGYSKASKEGKFATAMMDRAKAATKKLKAINEKANVKEVKDTITKMDMVNFSIANKAAIGNTAKEISTMAQEFAKNNDGKALGNIDSLIPKKYKGKPDAS